MPAPTATATSTAASDDARPGELELLGLAPEAGSGPAPIVSLRRQGASRRWLGAAAAALAVGAGAWAVGRSGSTGPEGDTGGGHGGARGAATSQIEEGSTDPTSPGGDSTGGTGQPETTDGTRGTEEATTGSGRTDGPVLGHPAGWSLLFGSPFRNTGTVRSLDLDTGVELSLSVTVEGAPVLAQGDRLVLAVGIDSPEPVLRIVPLADPAAGGPEVPMGQSGNPIPFGRPVLPGPDATTIWLYFADDAGRTAWRLIRLSDGEQVAELQAGASLLVAPVPGGGPDVVTSPGGGVYGRRGDGDDYRFITGGQPVVVSGNDVLVESCNSPTDCERRWLTVAGGAPADRPVPPGDGIYWSYLVPGSDRYLYGRRVVSIYEATSVIYDLERGRLIESEHNAAGGAASSPDGRIIAVHTDTGIDLYDVEQDRWVAVPKGNHSPLAFVFVPNG